MKREAIMKIMPHTLKEMILQMSDKHYEVLQEVRMRVHQPLILLIKGEEYGLNKEGICQIKESYKVSEQDVTGILKYISGFSLYALEDEMRQGYITIEGGHRVGLAGKVVMENNGIKTMKYISAINIRIAHQVLNCSKEVMPYILSRDKVYHTLIVSPPKCGKTTLLRDIIRNLSNGYSGYGPYTVGVVDERSEIAGCYQGVPQNDVGIRTDVLDGCPKVEGMRMLLRAMSPHVIAVDEIGKNEDIHALGEVLSAGITILSTVHGKDIEDCKKKPILYDLIKNSFFERIIILSNKYGPCTIEGILDACNHFNRLR
ncbi:stage III sporulation protein AA [Cellulosilyticum sp. I15G10I2]|uniref:stage III sporulation protein AA n=1 Tax=Cellulosilyticum sp. I15G10I2 TaxID=1892843 RepID=UPI00085BF674|nr:stage III sporulation protein AA [Cellulosilyticum sp. I15G10I2]